jgi:hypothetical protein
MHDPNFVTYLRISPKNIQREKVTKKSSLKKSRYLPTRPTRVRKILQKISDFGFFRGIKGTCSKLFSKI